MQRLTILMVQSGTANETAAIRQALPAVIRHLEQDGGFLGQRFAIEVWDDVERTEAGSVALAERVARRADIAAVVMWGGSWTGPATASIQQAFVDRTAELPFIYLSGSVLPEHARHPGSFSLAPAFRDKVALLGILAESLQRHHAVGWISKSTDDPKQLAIVRETCERRGTPMWAIELPKEFETTSPMPHDWDRLRGMIEAQPPATHWFLGAYALNRPLREWLRETGRAVEIVQLNTGRVLDWFGQPSGGGEVFFGSDSSSEKPELALSRVLGLDARFPRIKLDSLMLLQHAATLVPPLPASATREEVFKRWLEGMRMIDGEQSVFVGTRTTLWFDPETRMRRSGAITLKQRQPGSEQGLLHPIQIEPRTDGSIARVPVAYLFVDLLSMENVSVEQQDVELDFFLDIRSEAPITIRDLRLLNAKRRTLVVQNLIDHQEQEQGRTVHVRRYRVTGTFSFAAEMRCYPADSQSIDIAISATNPQERNILLQPPPRTRLDRDFDVPGWQIVDAEVSNHTMFWHSPTSRDFRMRYRPYNAVGFHWLVSRRSKDTVLFVAVPMAVLLGVSYFAALSTIEDAGTKVAELTGAMLATIALYFATSKPRCDELTILDRSFRMAYILIGGLLATNLLTFNLLPAAYEWAMQAWLLLFPLCILYELLTWRAMVRRQAKSFRQIEHGSEA
jgi:hypothetical protein